MNLEQVVEKLGAYYYEPVRFVARGKSMEPKIHDGEEVVVRRLNVADELRKEDIVLAKVKGIWYLHKITAINKDQFQISNNHGHVNGWTSRENIVGRLVKLPWET